MLCHKNALARMHACAHIDQVKSLNIRIGQYISDASVKGSAR